MSVIALGVTASGLVRSPIEHEVPGRDPRKPPNQIASTHGVCNGGPSTGTPSRPRGKGRCRQPQRNHRPGP